MVLSEAGATELPVISTNVAAIPEIVKDGETGFIIPTGDTDAITNSLRRLIADPQLRYQQGQQAKTIVSGYGSLNPRDADYREITEQFKQQLLNNRF